MELSPVSKEEFQAEQDRDRGTGRIALGEFGQQRHGATKIGRLICTKPEINAAQVATLAGPARVDARDRLPDQALVMDMERHQGEWGTRVQPAGFLGGTATRECCVKVEGNHQPRNRKCHRAYRGRLEEPFDRRGGASWG